MKKYLAYISQNYSFAILRPVQQLLQQRGDEVIWFFEGNDVNPDYLLDYEQRLISIEQVMAYQADVVLAPANSIPSFIPGLKVAVFHGFDAGKLDSRGRNDHFKIRGCFDLYCTQGPGTTREFQKLQKKFKFFNVIQTGWPALDPLFDEEKILEKESKPTILFCSTFSKKLSCAKALYATVRDISRTGKWRWLVQFHPKMDAEVVQMYRDLQNDYLTFVETDNIIPLLRQADVMLCDTSSVIDMFVVQNKPVVTFKNLLASDHLLDIDDSALLETALEDAIDRPQALMQKIHQHIEQLHPYRDDHSSQRVIQAIDDVLVGKYPLSCRRPSNFLRNLKFRKKFHYWKFTASG